MFLHTRILFLLAWFSALGQVSAQHAVPPSYLAEELCACLGQVDPASNDRSFDLAVRLCLNTAVTKRSAEVTDLLRRYPVQDRRFFLLGLVLGSALDRSCPQYPLVKDRLRFMLQAENQDDPST